MGAERAASAVVERAPSRARRKTSPFGSPEIVAGHKDRQPFATRLGRGARARVEAASDLSTMTQLRPFALAS